MRVGLYTTYPALGGNVYKPTLIKMWYQQTVYKWMIYVDKETLLGITDVPWMRKGMLFLLWM